MKWKRQREKEKTHFYCLRAPRFVIIYWICIAKRISNDKNRWPFLVSPLFRCFEYNLALICIFPLNFMYIFQIHSTIVWTRCDFAAQSKHHSEISRWNYLLWSGAFCWHRSGMFFWLHQGKLWFEFKTLTA